MRKKKYLKNIGVLLTDEQYERLVQITDEREVPMSKFIREIVQEKIGQINNGQINGEVKAEVLEPITTAA
jgi:predicted DNA-binding protein